MLADTGTLTSHSSHSHPQSHILAANHHHQYTTTTAQRLRDSALPTTAKLSPLILNRNLHVPPSAYERTMGIDRTNRKRRSSSIVYHEPPESFEQLSDQAALPNLNAEWVNAKGEWS